MSAIPALILAAVEYFLTRRDSKQLAKDFQVSENDLARTFARTQTHSWASKLAAAINDPSHRSDLLLLKRQLACFEQQYGDLLIQFQYARQTCEQIRNMRTFDPALILKADSLAFRIQQSAGRVLRDIQKTELRLEKAEKTPPASANSEDSQADRVAATQPRGAQAAAAKTPAPPTDALPTEDEFKSVIFKHRHKVKDASPADRPALIARLIQQEREDRARVADSQHSAAIPNAA